MIGPLTRTFDVLASAAGLLVLAPVLAGAAICVRLSMGSPVLFRQTRIGYKGRSFTLLKFRTMRDSHGPDGLPLPDADRVTPVGDFLRRSSLDELPQLWNVLRGDMSLVGPRPLLPAYLPLYSDEQARRHDVKPGITGWAQVNGRNALSWSEKFRLDVWYVDNQSIWVDLRILLLTVKKVILGDGVNQGERVTMEPFRGNAQRPLANRPAGREGGRGLVADDDELDYMVMP